MKIKTIIQSKNQRKYRIIEKYIAGIVLTGNEIKSLRVNQVSISEAFISFQKKEPYIVSMYIAHYQQAHSTTYQEEPRRKRKILLQKREIRKLVQEAKSKNYAIIPLQVFLNEKGWAKIEFALVQHLKKFQLKSKKKEEEVKRQLRKKGF